MSNWTYKMEMYELKSALEEEKISVRNMAQALIFECHTLIETINKDDSSRWNFWKLDKSTIIEYLQESIDEFEEFLEIFEDGEDGIEDEFEYYMDKLYDIADLSLDGRFGGAKLCWINTFASHKGE